MSCYGWLLLCCLLILNHDFLSEAMAALRTVRRSSAAVLRGRWKESSTGFKKDAFQLMLDHDNHDERERFWKNALGSEVGRDFASKGLLATYSNFIMALAFRRQLIS